ncbi:unnamed protein product [Caenorhabditis sp. 36 PRJEB53466]|nr:unnamed protein product [Caenorhabditis sp. 36 PRJEB53466]
MSTTGSDACQKCARTHARLENSLKRAVDLEQELATYEQFMQRHMDRKKEDANRNETEKKELKEQLAVSKSHFESALTANNEQTRRVLQQVESKCRRLESDLEEYKHMEGSYLKRIMELEKENQGLKAACRKSADTKMFETLLERMKILEETHSQNSSFLTNSSTFQSTSTTNSASEEKLIEMNERKYQLELADPIAQAQQLIQRFMTLTDDRVRILKLEMFLDDFAYEYTLYVTALESNIDMLMKSAELSDLEPLPDFPNPLTPELMAQFEAALKKDNSPRENRFTMNTSNCQICERSIEKHHEIEACDSCGQHFHRECGRVFSERQLNCVTPGCTSKFGGANWR